jgi:hypothetical protein
MTAEVQDSLLEELVRLRDLVKELRKQIVDQEELRKQLADQEELRKQIEHHRALAKSASGALNRLSRALNAIAGVESDIPGGTRTQ